MTNRIAVSSDELKPVCERWKFQRLWLFGSALREDFHSESDVDLLVEFAHDADWGLLDHVRNAYRPSFAMSMLQFRGVRSQACETS
jgi:predicted nucleotidyltransferase